MPQVFRRKSFPAEKILEAARLAKATSWRKICRMHRVSPLLLIGIGVFLALGDAGTVPGRAPPSLRTVSASAAHEPKISGSFGLKRSPRRAGPGGIGAQGTLRIRGGAASDIPPLNSTEVELENGAEEQGGAAEKQEQQGAAPAKAAAEAGEAAEAEAAAAPEEQQLPPPSMPHHTGEAEQGDQGYVQLPEDLRMPPGMQHMYQWEAPDGNQVHTLPLLFPARTRGG